MKITEATHRMTEELGQAELKIVSSLAGLEGCLTALKTKASAISQSYADVVRVVSENSEQLRDNIDKQACSIVQKIESDNRKERENEARSKNVILFGVEEASDRADWTRKIEDLLSECHVNLPLTETNVFRLGRYEKDKGTSRAPRPVKLCTSSEAQKWETERLCFCKARA